MTQIIALDDRTLEQLQREGEVKVEDAQGLPLVVMTVAARQQLQKLECDSGDWTPEEMRTVAQQWLDDPAGWGARGMEAYDEMSRDETTDNGETA